MDLIKYKKAIGKYSDQEIRRYLSSQGISATGTAEDNQWLAAIAMTQSVHVGAMPTLVKLAEIGKIPHSTMALTDKYILIAGEDEIKVYPVSDVPNVRNLLNTQPMYTIPSSVQKILVIDQQTIAAMDMGTGASIYSLNQTEATRLHHFPTCDKHIALSPDKSLLFGIGAQGSFSMIDIVSGTLMGILYNRVNEIRQIIALDNTRLLLETMTSSIVIDITGTVIDSVTVPARRRFAGGDDTSLPIHIGRVGPDVRVISQYGNDMNLYIIANNKLTYKCLMKNIVSLVQFGEYILYGVPKGNTAVLTMAKSSDISNEHANIAEIEFQTNIDGAYTLFANNELVLVANLTNNFTAYYDPSKEYFSKIFRKTHQRGTADREQRHPQINRLPPELLGYIEQYI